MTSEALLRSQQNAYSWTHGLPRPLFSLSWTGVLAKLRGHCSAVKGASPSLFLPSLVQFHYKHHLLNSMKQNVIKLQRRTRRQNPNIAQTSSSSLPPQCKPHALISLDSFLQAPPNYCSHAYTKQTHTLSKPLKTSSSAPALPRVGKERSEARRKKKDNKQAEERKEKTSTQKHETRKKKKQQEYI